MATISPVIGAPNSFTAIDEAFVTTEPLDEQEQSQTEQRQQQKPIVSNQSNMDTNMTTSTAGSAHPVNTSLESDLASEPLQVTTTATTLSQSVPYEAQKTVEMPMSFDKDKEAMNAALSQHSGSMNEKFETSPQIRQTYDSDQNTKTYSPGYFQRALDALRGRRNSESYSAHTSKTKTNLESTIFGESSHAKSLGLVKMREVDPTLEKAYRNTNTSDFVGHSGSRPYTAPDAPYNIHGSNHPSVMGRKDEVSDSIITDLSRGYHSAIDSFKHAMGFDKREPSNSNMVKITPQPEVLADSAKPARDGPQTNVGLGNNPTEVYLNHPSLGGEYQQPPHHKTTVEELTDKEFPLLL